MKVSSAPWNQVNSCFPVRENVILVLFIQLRKCGNQIPQKDFRAAYTARNQIQSIDAYTQNVSLSPGRSQGLLLLRHSQRLPC